jgi:serine/threonine-protein kinase
MKVIRGLRDGISLARFAREVEIAARIDHPNVISVLDVGFSQHDFVFLVMELVVGSPLSTRLTPPSQEWALSVIGQTASGLAAIHASGFVHRDLKPANILLSEAPDSEPHVKITDFGIAALQRDIGETLDERAGPPPPTSSRPQPIADAALTQSGAFLGTPPYIAPELAGGMRFASPAADLFALGVIAHELLTGTRPFKEPPVLLAMQGSYRRPASLAEITALDPAVAEVLDRCLSADPVGRPSAEQVMRAVERARVPTRGRASTVRG